MIVLLYFLFCLALAIYSFSQIDLNLTLFHFPAFLSFQQNMIQLGYFNRAASFAIFLSLTIVGFVIFAQALSILRKNPSVKTLIFAIIVVLCLGMVSYPAFSHDIFNYLFDAKVLAVYHLNPYTSKALDFALDPWLRFMHWTHRTYPYGPIWLALTAPLALIGQDKFVFTLTLFKGMFGFFYVSCVWLIYKIVHKTNSNKAVFAAASFALNPLVIYESIVSPHLDLVMSAFLLLGFYFLLFQKRPQAIISFLLSGGIKFLTFPMTILPLTKKLDFTRQVKVSIAILLALLTIVIFSREAYPWYFLPPLALAAILVSSRVQTFVTIFSLAILLQYGPYIFYGEYINQVFVWKALLVVGGLILATIGFFLTPKESGKAS